MSAVFAMDPAPAAVDLSGISMVFDAAGGPVAALRNVNLSVPKNRFVSIVGRSGCGKSTLLRIVCGLAKPTSGRVLIDGLDPAAYQRERRFGFVFQDATLLPWKTAIQNVVMPMQIQKHIGPAMRQQWARELLRLVRLTDFADHYPSQLSGGMRQRVAIARALSYDPEILLMDEPFGALDEFTRQEMNEELTRLWQERSGTILFVTHNLSEALFLSDVVVVMSPSPGRVRAAIEVDLPRPRPPSTRSDPKFVSQLAALEEVIRDD
jgi:NitT/TauT family transport system ATP-binding protein